MTRSINYAAASHVDYFKGDTLIRNAKVRKYCSPGRAWSFDFYLLENGEKIRRIDVAAFTIAK